MLPGLPESDAKVRIGKFRPKPASTNRETSTVFDPRDYFQISS